MHRDRDRYFDDEIETRRPTGGMPVAVIVAGVAIVLVIVAGLAVAALFVLRSAPRGEPAVVDVEVKPELAAKDRKPLARDQALGLGHEPGRPVVPVPAAGRSVTKLVFAGDEHGATALVAYKDQGAGYRIDVADTVNGRARGQVLTENISMNGVAASPDGKWLCVIESAPSDGDLVRLYDVAAGREAGKFTPYGKHRGPAVHVPSMVWAQFIAPDRLLTINEGSGFDVWTVPGFERLVGQPPRRPHAIPTVGRNGFTNSPTNFAVTRDGRTLIIFNGEGFTFYDTRTAAATGKTEPFMKDGGSANFFGAAVRADGSKFACYMSTYGDKPESPVAVWEVPSGRKVSSTQPAGQPSAAGMAWWGPDHLLFWQGGLSSANVLHVATGDVVGKVQFKDNGVLGTVPPTDGLWGLTPSSRIVREDVQPLLIRGAAIPRAIRPGAKLEIGPDGLIKE